MLMVYDPRVDRGGCGCGWGGVDVVWVSVWVGFGEVVSGRGGWGGECVW